MSSYISSWNSNIIINNNQISVEGLSTNLNLNIKAKGDGITTFGTNNGTSLNVGYSNVGIGTDNPLSNLDVNGNLNCHNLIVNSEYVVGDGSSCIWSNVKKKYILGIGSGLIAHYKFDGSATDMLSDSSGNNHHLTNNGTTFDGTDYVLGDGSTELSTTYLDFPNTINPYSIWNGKGITFCCWFKMASNVGNYARIFDFSDNAVGTNPTNYLLVCKNGASNNLFLGMKFSTGAETQTSSNNYFDDNWHFISWSINSSGYWTIYIDNVAEAITVSQPTTLGNFTPTKRYIGNSGYSSDGASTGNIDDFRIYDRVLSAAEVEKLYLEGSDGGLIAHYKFDGDLIDSSGNNHNLVSTGTIEYDESTYIHGKSSYLSGDDYFQTPSSLHPYNIWNGNGITISGWFKLKNTSNDWATIFEFNNDGNYRISVTKYGSSNTLWYGKNTIGSYNEFTTTTTIFDDVWHHIVLTIDTSGNAIIYIDNIAEPTRSGFTLDSTYSDLIISNSDAGSSLRKIIGNIDDFRIYNRVLSAAEVEKLYYAQYIQKGSIPSSTDEYIAFKYNPNLYPDIVYDFTLKDTESDWQTYANSIGTHDVTDWVANFQGREGGVFKSGSTVGSFTLNAVPSGYNYMTVEYGNPENVGTVRIYINNTEVDRVGANTYTTYSQTVSAGDVFKIEEHGASIIGEDLKITLSNTHTEYTINFPQPTECEILIVGGGGAGGGGKRAGAGGGAGGLVFGSDIIMKGNYNIKVGNGGFGTNGYDSSITKTYFSIVAKGGGCSASFYLRDGLKYEYYEQGYFNDNVNWFNSYTPVATGYVTDGTNIGTFSNNTRTIDSRNYYSFQWTGYFKASVSGTYTFYTQSDDASYCWLGSNAISGFTTSNALVRNGGLHGVATQSGTINLTANTYYPIRYQFGENSGGDNMIVSFTPPGGSRIYNGTGFFYSIINVTGDNNGGSGSGATTDSNSTNTSGGNSTQQTVISFENFTINGYGNDGGIGRIEDYGDLTKVGAGGGGAGEIGNNTGNSQPLNSMSYGGDGGIGKAFNITGISTYYAGGGGGGVSNNGSSEFPGIGGEGGGGDGGDNNTNGKNATQHTGGGGGGSGETGIGGNGGSGIVIIRYKSGIPTATASKTTNDIFFNSGNVGIGNDLTNYKLDFGKNASGGTSSDYGGMLSVYNNNGNYLYGIDADNYGTGYGLNFYASAGGKADGNIRMKIHRDTGNVGIGTTSPEQKLDVRGGMRLGNGTSAEQYIIYYNNTGNWRTGVNNSGNGTSSNQFYIYDNAYRLTVQKETGNVGIGTRLPEQKLDVRGGMRLGDGTTAEQDIICYNNTGNWQTGINNSGNGTSGNQFYIYDNAYRLTVQKETGNVGIGTTSPEQKLDVRGGMRLGDGTTAEQDIICYNNTGNWRTGINNSGNGTSGNQFYIYDNAYRLTVQKETGNVGIGTTLPTEKLDVRGGMRLGDGTTAEQDIICYNNTGNWQTGINNSGNGTSGNQFYIYDNAYRLTVQKETGNVGIGTTSPEQKLDVRGGMRLGDGTTAEQDIICYNNTGNWQVGVNNSGDGTSGNRFYIYETGEGATPYRLTVQKETGNVGIGLFQRSPTEKLDVDGNIRAINFIGNGSGLTHINANNISSGFINASRLPSDMVVTSISGDGSGLTNINANNITGVLSIDKGGTNANTAEIARNNLGIITTFQLNGTNAYYNDGNVGIGTNDPQHKLDLLGDVQTSNIYVRSIYAGKASYGTDVYLDNFIYFGNNMYIKNMYGYWYNPSAYVFRPTKELILHSNNSIRLKGEKISFLSSVPDVATGGVLMTITNLGLGIRTSTPLYSLDLTPSSNWTVSWYENGITLLKDYVSYGYYRELFYWGFQSDGDSIFFFIYHAYKSINWNNIYNIFILGSGNIGLGTDGPTEKLDVRYGNIHHSGSIVTSSDLRIKYDISDLDDNEMLNKLMLIEPKKYKYKDKSKGNDEVYGFIAQQVKDVMGDFAVKLNKGYIYDINNVATINSNIITSTSNLELSSNYKIIINNCEKDVTVDEILEDNSYKISGYDYNSNISQDIFIQGKLVDDFHLLKKTAIFTMNVGATQELYKIINIQKDIIINLINRIEILESKI